MAGVVGDINPKTMESAKRQFVELYGSALVMNTYLKIALVLVSLVALGLLALNFHTASRYSQVKPLVVRIDEVGRAEAVQYDASRYQPQPPELRYFLTQFVAKHFSRIRSTLQAVLFREHAALIGAVALILFLNLTATYYSVARWLFLRDTGRKLLHLDRQLATDDAVLDDLRSYLK